MHYEDFFDPPEGEEGYSRKLDRDIIDDDDDDADDGEDDEEGDDHSNEEGGDAEMEKSQEDKIKDELGVM